MSRRLPPLNPLHVFEVAARSQSFSDAAQQLHISQSAVSRQISVLETYLGVDLFRRERHGVVLTRVGQNYAEQIAPAFDAITNASANLRKGTTQGALRVRAYTTFTAKWLIPRLPGFRAQHPDIEVRIVNGVSDVDFDRDAVDVAIQYGDGKWPRTRADFLFADVIEPVCTPAYLQSLIPVASKHLKKSTSYDLKNLLTKRLLVSKYRKNDWDEWLQMQGLEDTALKSVMSAERMVFSSSVLSWQAALDGLGIAMGQTAFLSQELMSRQLICPFNSPLMHRQSHYLLRPKAQRDSRKVTAFRDWILTLTQQSVDL